MLSSVKSFVDAKVDRFKRRRKLLALKKRLLAKHKPHRNLEWFNLRSA